MKNFIIITGPQAVGKMAVGLALREKYNYRLFHNHMAIDMVADIYGDFKREMRPLVNEIRELIFDNTVNQNLDGFVFTLMWGFHLESSHEYVKNIIEKFESHEWHVTIVELEADLDTRLQRNRTALRLDLKSTKRNLEWSDNDLKNSMEKYRLNSYDGEIKHSSYLRINNQYLEPDVVADKIYDYINNK